MKRTSTELTNASPAGEKSTEYDSVIPMENLTGMERTALYQIVGSRYVAETRMISDRQLQIVRKFAGFDWLPSEREYWKGEFRDTTDATVSRSLNATHSSTSQVMEEKDPVVRAEHMTSSTRHVDIRSAPESLATKSSDLDSDWQTNRDEWLNEEQQRVYDFIEQTGKNVFISGRAGSGKSFLLRYLLKNSQKRTLPVAFMGIAALNIGGLTIHSAFGLPLQLLLPSTGRFLAECLSKEKRASYREFKMLVVDEVSMVAADRFVVMDMFLRSIHERDEPFGGIQVVLFGDPYQLPPIVIKQAEVEFYADNWGGPNFFGTETWHVGSFIKVELQGTERQSDRSFLAILDAMRVGELSDENWKSLRNRVFHESELPADGVVRVSPVNEVADRFNERRLRELPGMAHLFVGEASVEYRKSWKRLPAPTKLYLKAGAQVIMVKNDTGRRWVNGSVGYLTEVSEKKIIVEIDGLQDEVSVVDWDKKNHKYDRANKVLEPDGFSRYRQYPMALGWARTIHKSQGQTFDKCVVDLRSNMFARGQAYVACSRTRNIEGLFLTAPLSVSDVLSSAEVHRFMSDLIPPYRP